MGGVFARALQCGSVRRRRDRTRAFSGIAFFRALRDFVDCGVLNARTVAEGRAALLACAQCVQASAPYLPRRRDQYDVAGAEVAKLMEQRVAPACRDLVGDIFLNKTAKVKSLSHVAWQLVCHPLGRRRAPTLQVICE